MENIDLKKRFIEIYGAGGEVHIFHSPGRVNLIGEHTDYNGGYVFPCALSFGTMGAVRKRDDKLIKLTSENFKSTAEVYVDQLKYESAHGWANYPKGVVDQFIKLGHNISGFELLLYGNMPNAAGLSSSASIELLTAAAINRLFDCKMDMVEMVKLSQRAENQFVGVNCGIMDQFAVGMGRKDMAIFLDCMKLEYEYVPFLLKRSKLIIANTNVRRGLADSKYNERRSECDKAVAYLQKELNIMYLGNVSEEQFETYKALIDDPVVQKRAAHIIYEDGRVLEAVKKLRAGDIQAFGELMRRSHESLRDLYEVTGMELDALVEEAWRMDGVIGSRMTGAGFGGCTVSIVEDDTVDKFIREVGDRYQARTGLKADFYIVDTGDGTREIDQ